MAYTKIPEKDAMLLVRALGLLVSQAGVYGPSHNVTQGTARSVFAELEQAVRSYGPIEISLRGQQILINGSADGVNEATGRNLSDRMALHKISGLLFLAPPDSREFLKCVTLFGTQPLMLEAEGGFENAVKKERLRSVRVVAVAYQRVEGDKPALKKPPEAPPTSPFVDRRPVASSSVLDLSAAFASVEKEPDPEPEEELARRKRADEMAALLREVASLLESGKGGAAQELPPSVADALSRIRGYLSDMATGSERQISTLADQVSEDRQTIASIESAARRRGITLRVSRGELVQRYAELNQEIMQPLTVSTGVIDMLQSGCVGALTEPQRELLKMAAESVERVNQLVAYMTRISGLPESLSPDAETIAATYR